ncbi:MAG: hypothetical protein JW822_14000 [Spirochaetales bacterium]|nr:hypothetical protein [Spirochaetales bacterium]
MYNKIVTARDELVRIGSLLLQNMYHENFITLFVDNSFDISLSDLACLYLYNPVIPNQNELVLHYSRGNCMAVKSIPSDSELVVFLNESKEAVILSRAGTACFSELLLCQEMQSGIALNIGLESQQFGVFILNSLHANHYTQEQFEFLNKLCTLAGGMFNYWLQRKKIKNKGIRYE